MIAYTVTATTDDPAQADRFVAWLLGDPQRPEAPGHARQVVQAGARRVQVVRIEPESPGGPITVQCRYLFDSMAAYEAYDRGPAQALRAEGRRLFPPGGPIALSRSLGTVLLEHPMVP
ncbi:MAG: hypothetical protein KatS3mg103_0759 [Phycisphaerales bacterium]|nr:MAG: hypothetical protein KatS3mg103_0759 [Phycisphaerales bacterium]